MSRDNAPLSGGEAVTSYHLAKTGEGWAVVDNAGNFHGVQPTRAEGKKLLDIVRHMKLARRGFLPWH